MLSVVILKDGAPRESCEWCYAEPASHRVIDEAEGEETRSASVAYIGPRCIAKNRTYRCLADEDARFCA